jgi:hypothetical protein
MQRAVGIQLKGCSGSNLSVFCKDAVIRQLAWNPLEFDAPSRPESVLLFTGARAYRRGNGWWTIAGYAQDRSDVRAVEDRVNDLITNPPN